MNHSEKVFKILEDVGELVTESLRLEWLIKLTMNLLDITSDDLKSMGIDDGDFRKFIDISMQIPEDELFNGLSERQERTKAGRK